MLYNNHIGYLHFWCQKVLPLVYDNSLSYYEVLLKLQNKLNEVIKYTNEIPDYIDKKVIEAFDEEHLRELISDVFKTIEDAITANNEGTNTNFSKDYPIAGTLVWHDNKLYETMHPIDAGDAIIPYSNIKLVNFGDMFNEFLTEVKTRFTDNDDGLRETSSADRPVHDLVWLNNILYEVIKPIAEGNAYIYSGANKNVEPTNLDKIFDYLLDLISSEINAREEADDTLQDHIDVEADAREGADSTLQGNIDAEAEAREGADSTLQGNIDAEAEAREGVDNEIKGIIGNLANLQTPNKTNIVNAINSVVNIVNDKDYVCPEDFGAVGDGVTDDTAAVQQALYANKPIKFLHDYAVTSVLYTNSSNFIDFNGHWLIGIGQNNDFVLVIYEAMYNVFNNVRISISPASQPHYYGCIRIHSSSSRQSQYNVFNGMDLRECWHGLVWGAKDGETSVSNAQSETFINNFRDRSVAIPFLGNQDNGYLTFIGGVFDVNQYEQWVDNRFSFDDNRCIANRIGKVNFIGCEFAATVNVNHIGFVGGDIHAYDSILEICGTQAFITGDFSLVNWYNGYIGQVSKTPFIVNNGTKGKVILENGTFHHGGVVAGNTLFYGYDAPETIVYLNNVTFADTPYALDMFGNLNVKCNNFRLPADNITINDTDDITGLSLIDNNSTDIFAFGNEFDCHASFDSILGRRGIAVQFTGGTTGGYYSAMIPIYGGTLFHANSCGFTDGNEVYISLEYFDGNGDYIGADSLQVLNGVRLNRSKIKYAPSGARTCRLRISNGDSALQVYAITCNIAIYWKRRVEQNV